MKKLLITLVAAIAVTFSANAVDRSSFSVGAVDRSSFSVGGSAGISLTGFSNGSFGWTITPEGQCKINEDMAVGLGLGFTGASAWLKDSNASSFTFVFSVTPYYRWYFGNFNRVRFFLDGIVLLGCSTQSETYTMYDQKIKTSYPAAFAWGVAAEPGIAFDVTERFAIITHIASIGVVGVDSSCSFSLSAISGPSIGVEYSF